MTHRCNSGWDRQNLGVRAGLRRFLGVTKELGRQRARHVKRSWRLRKRQQRQQHATKSVLIDLDTSRYASTTWATPGSLAPSLERPRLLSSASARSRGSMRKFRPHGLRTRNGLRGWSVMEFPLTNPN